MAHPRPETASLLLLSLEEDKWKEIWDLPSKDSIRAMTFDKKRQIAVILACCYIGKDTFGIFEIQGEHVVECKQVGAPPYRSDALLGYDQKNDRMIMYGGYSDRFPFGERIYEETWSIVYHAEKEVYVWNRID